MAAKVSVLLVALLYFGHSSFAKNSHSSSSSEEKYPISKKDCKVDPHVRRDCGYSGISESECKKRNCCFDSSILNVNFCFFSRSQDKEQCSSNKKDRKNCGHSGISARDCYSKGCCYDPSDRSGNECYKPTVKSCAVTHKNRKDCGYPYISAKDCFSRGCCFDDSVPQTIWCYYGTN
ncbi:hypothetical protein XENTR_v10004779 [Xenopus tropicalis]|uniref:Trefoil factor 2 n=1 Tax=Xenopus tropicalis TaxID=8364 RepID=A0A8J0QU96_XENTR|nr:trefoil factor 2 [Xenopus tropicalis]KAE8621344.1 hypothetical protein XENTR_v10004779 [Xenopus tropicalis]|eukprot:XP_002940507.2 PREDICTED: trefoil factor 2-like [Xenopus tropicalis]